MQRQLNGESTVFSTYGIGTTGHPLSKNMNLNPKSHPIQKLTPNGSWISIYTVKVQSFRRKQEKIEENLHDVRVANKFIDLTPKA